MKKEKDERGGGPAPAAIADPRFARVHTDPRFMRMPKNKSKVSIDKRFSHMFSDKNFSDPLGADKRGRAKKKKEKHMLERYYKVGEGEENAEDESEAPLKSKVVAKSKKKSGGKSSNLVRPKFPGPVAPSKLGLDESDAEEDSDEEIDLKPKLKGKKSGEKVRSKQLEIAESESNSDEEIDLKPKLKGKKSGEKVRSKQLEIAESESDSDEEIDLKPKLKGKKSGEKVRSKQVEIAESESDSDEEVSLKSKLKGKKSVKKLVRPKSPEPEVDSEEESDEEIDLNSEESEEEIRNGKTQEDDDSEEEEEDDDAEGSSSSSSSSSSESEGEEDVSDLRDREKVPTASGAETRRLAMMNMDWEHIKAADLLMLMRSFQPKGGRVECVTIYPSEFGIEQLKAEEVHGPNMIFEDEEDDEDEDKEVNMEKLRAYEKNKLKYYYAVVECDTKETANHLYTQCDGLEFERTSNILDLRFIPDDLTFAREPRDVAKEVQDGYKAPEFETRALQHSTVKLTWDDDEPTRVKALRKKFNADELNEMDFRAYLASESSEDEVGDDEDESPSSPERGDAPNEDGAKSKKDKYRSLLLGGTSEEVERPGQKKKKGDVDMEVTFHTGLTELSEKLMQKKEAKKRGDETVWEAYLRKKKEKKSQKKRSKNAKDSDDDYSDEGVASPRAGQGEADPFFTHDDTGFDDPFFADDAAFPDESKAAPKKKSNSKDSERLKKKEEKEQQKKEEERSKAELELLLMDDEGVQGAARGFNLKSKDKKKKEKGKKRGKKAEDDQDEPEDKLATADLTDPRFAPLFSNHHYAIDPTNPQFRKSAAQLKILAEAQRRRSQKSDDNGDAASDGLNGNAALGSQDRKRKAELSSLVRSLKRKAGKPGLVKPT